MLEFEVADHVSREILASYHFPVGYLDPFHHYHLDMTLVSIYTLNAGPWHDTGLSEHLMQALDMTLVYQNT